MIDIDPAPDCPPAGEVREWTAEQYAGCKVAGTTRGIPSSTRMSRQLLHVGYKIAAKLGEPYTDMLLACEESISRNVTQNLYDRHIVPLFLRM